MVGATVRSFQIKILVLMWNARLEDKGRHGKFGIIWLDPYLIQNKWGEDFISYFLQGMIDKILELLVHG